MHEHTGDLFYLRRELQMAELALSLMRDVGGDGRLEWPCLGADKAYCHDHDSNEATVDIKKPLAAERAAKEVTGVARLIFKAPALSAFRARAIAIKDWIVKNIVQHPIYASRFT